MIPTRHGQDLCSSELLSREVAALAFEAMTSHHCGGYELRATITFVFMSARVFRLALVLAPFLLIVLFVGVVLGGVRLSILVDNGEQLPHCHVALVGAPQLLSEGLESGVILNVIMYRVDAEVIHVVDEIGDLALPLSGGLTLLLDAVLQILNCCRALACSFKVGDEQIFQLAPGVDAISGEVVKPGMSHSLEHEREVTGTTE